MRTLRYLYGPGRGFLVGDSGGASASDAGYVLVLVAVMSILTAHYGYGVTADDLWRWVMAPIARVLR